MCFLSDVWFFSKHFPLKFFVGSSNKFLKYIMERIFNPIDNAKQLLGLFITVFKQSSE